jgi:hypothetical protein
MSSILTLEQIEKNLAEIAAEVRAEVENLVTEDDAPMDSVFSEKQMRLLTEPLYSSWNPMSQDGTSRQFLVMANVGLFYSLNHAPIVPDVLLSMDVKPPDDPKPKYNRSYFTWEYSKAPELVIEIVSNREGNEDTSKLDIYAQVGVLYYAIHDPHHYLGNETLKLHELSHKKYVPREELYLPEIGLGLMLWEGRFENWQLPYWLRWCGKDGQLIPTGKESTQREAVRAEREAVRAEREAERAAAAESQKLKLAAKLREMGIDPEKL